jgi:hypothetical protein
MHELTDWLARYKLSPAGRLKIGGDALLDNFQPSLRDLIMFHGVPRTIVLG